jgi:DNA-binding transcriptional ArsR family regulator
MIGAMDEITLLQAEVLRTMANPRRIQILHELAEGPIEVGRLVDRVGASQPNVSQHLAAMRAVGLVESERDGREVRYRLADARSVEACELMRTVIADRLRRLAAMTQPDGSGGRTATTTPAAVGSDVEVAPWTNP